MTQTVVDFEGVNAPGALADIAFTVSQWEVPMYFGMQWNNFGTLDGVRRPGSGFHQAVTSGDSVAYNQLEDPASVAALNGDFALTGGWFSAAWSNGLTMTVVGYNDGVEVARQTATLNVAKQWVAFGAAFGDVDRVVFVGAGGVDANPRDRGEGTHIAVDNLTFDSTREVARFEGIARQKAESAIADGTCGMSWSNIRVVDDGFTGLPGTINGLHSKEAAAYTVAGTVGEISSVKLNLFPAQTRRAPEAQRDFDFESGWFASTGPASQAVTVEGYDNGILVAQQTITLTTTAKKFAFDSSFDSVDTVRFQSGGASISMDDLVFVIEPPGVGYVEPFIV